MDIVQIFTTAFLVGFSGAMMPGPLLTVAIGESARRGFIAGPLIVLGHAILELVLIAGLAAGLFAVLKNETVTQVISVVGGLFLIYMGFTMARDAWQGRISLQLSDVRREAFAGDSDAQSQETPDRRDSVLKPISAGIFVSLANPFWIIWWATVGLGYITMSMKLGTPGIASFYSGHILADLTWYSAISAAVAGGRRFMNNRTYRDIIFVCGIALIGLGGYFARYGLLS